MPQAKAFYNPSTGRWLSRDPIDEFGGRNLYGFLDNFSTGQFDFLGLRCCLITYKAGGGYKGHSILQCDNGAYVSVFPSGRPISSPPEWRDPATDAKYFKGRTPDVKCTECLDETKVSNWLAEAKKNNENYSCFSANCADVTMNAIAAGLSDERSKKPECPWSLLERLGGGYREAQDILDSGGIITPSWTASALDELIKNGCNRYKCVWKMPLHFR